MINKEFISSKNIGVRWVSNVLEIKADLDYEHWAATSGGWFGSSVGNALREFFKYLEDQELKRWRWPGDSAYVVYSNPTGGVRVVHETTGYMVEVPYNITETPKAMLSRFEEAAIAYFTFRRNSSPWQGARPGEIWLLAIDAHGERPFEVESRPGGEVCFVSHTLAESYLSTDNEIMGGKLIWSPEDTPEIQ